MDLFSCLARPVLFSLDPERAHGLSIAALKTGLTPSFGVHNPLLEQTIAGLHFPNPLGIAAGYDKNAEVPNALLRMGFGFAEVGTLTPLPQNGNPKPRLFRLTKDEAIINRMGFNNEGHQAALKRLQQRSKQGLVGVNIGANKESQDRIADYVAGIACFYAVADYFTVNISSPNTPGLRDLQNSENLGLLLQAIEAERDKQQQNSQIYRPIFLKIAPDLDELALDTIVEQVLAHKIDAIIVSNTTLSRQNLRDAQASETGGMSGKPLFTAATIILAKLRQRVGPDFVLIGAGGIHDGQSAVDKIMAGADLIQLYSGLVYQGPQLITTILNQLIETMQQMNVSSLRELRDHKLDEWAAKPIQS